MNDKEKVLTLEKDEHGVAILTYDLPGRPMNVITDQATQELSEMADVIAADDGIKAVVLMGKPENFLAGADISMIQYVKTEEDAYNMSKALQNVLKKYEDLPKPVIAAINGPCLGGGLEVAMACHYRIATTSPKTVLGVPEVKLGLLPGAGGTQRLPRLIPLDKAMDGILTGMLNEMKNSIIQDFSSSFSEPSEADTAALSSNTDTEPSLKLMRN